jgi:5-hydroxyisourate hydrolase
MGRLTTHVLDTAHGCPAAGLVVHLFSAPSDGSRTELVRVTLNADGRADAPLLAGEAFKPGRYSLVFHAGDYFRARGVVLPEPAFADVITLDVGLADASGHYHVPLLVSPWSWSTYRGS